MKLRFEANEWWYGSFTSKAGFLGACYVQGVDAIEADLAAWKLAPGGADQLLMIGPISPNDMRTNVPPDHRLRLILAGDPHLADMAFDAEELGALGAECGYQVHVHDKGVMQ